MTKKIILTFVIALASLMASATVPSNLQDETLTYKVLFKWGLIHKQAGTARLTLRNVGNQYHTKLTARSDNWADKFFMVRDTLTGIVNKDGFLPVKYVNVSHEGGDYKHDVVTYKRAGSTTKAHCVHNKLKKKSTEMKTKVVDLESNLVALDMLSVYFYMRWIDYPALGIGGKEKLHVFSGRRKELLTVTYLGEQTIKLDKTQVECYHISFTFTSDSGKKTSDGMDAWISKDNRRIPIKLEGKLPVGKVHCLYTGAL